MKGFFKVMAIIAGCLALLGLILGIIAVASGANMNDFWNLRYGAVETTYSDVEALDIDIGAAAMVIQEGDEFKIETTGIAKNALKNEVAGGVWRISNTQRRGVWRFWNWRSFIEEQRIVVTIPKDATLRTLRVKVGAGRLEAASLRASTAELFVGAGDITIDYLTASDAKIDCGVGNISVSGRIDGQSRIDCGVGRVALQLTAAQKEYDYDLDVGVGQIKIGDFELSGLGSKQKIDNGASDSFTIDCGVGHVSLTFTQ